MNHFGSLAGDCCCWRVCCWTSFAKASRGSRWEVDTTITPVFINEQRSSSLVINVWQLTREIVFQEFMIAPVDDAKETVSPSIEPRCCRWTFRTRKNKQRCGSMMIVYFWCAADTALCQSHALDWRCRSWGRWQRNHWGVSSLTYSVAADCWSLWFPDVSFSRWSDCSLDLDSSLNGKWGTIRWTWKSYLRMEDDRMAESIRQTWGCFCDKYSPHRNCIGQQWSDKMRLEWIHWQISSFEPWDFDLEEINFKEIFDLSPNGIGEYHRASKGNQTH